VKVGDPAPLAHVLGEDDPEVERPNSTGLSEDAYENEGSDV
jgi:hypothetical protein